MKPWPITPSMGLVDPDDQIGFDREYQRVLAAISGPGALITGPNQIGKTTLISRLERDLESTHTVIRLDGYTEDLDALVARLAGKLRKISVFRRAFERSELTVKGDVGPVSLGWQQKGWKSAPSSLDELFEWAAANAGKSRLIIIIDEIGYLVRCVEKVKVGRGEEFLRTLRRVRSLHPNISIVLTCSMGLHHVLPRLDLLEDLSHVPLVRATPDEIGLLARCLLLGRGRTAAIENRFADRIAEEAEGYPYYANVFAQEVLVRNLLAVGRSADAVRTLVREIRDDHVRQNIVRLEREYTTLLDYYGENRIVVVRALDAVANDPGLDWDDLAQVISEKKRSRIVVLSVLHRLRLDGIVTEVDSQVVFATSIHCDAWRMIRDLA